MKKITAINKAIQDAIKTVEDNAKRPLQEPDYIAAMAIELPRLVNAGGAFPGVKFGGCFIHQSPKVTFEGKYANPSICELGDLLVLCHDVVDGDDRYNAALIQWKKTNSGVEYIIGSALKQLDLYEHWPLFEINSCGCQFDILPKAVTPGAQYGLIQPGTPTSLFCTIPSMTLKTTDSPSFARFIINMMKWQTGRPVVLNKRQCAMDSWSELILHLLILLRERHFRRSNIYPDVQPRAPKDILQMLTSSRSENGDEIVITSREEEDEGCVSVMYIDMANGREAEYYRQ